jgi:CHAT domain-containing protein/Tfp pilus assembly protein PilF
MGWPMETEIERAASLIAEGRTAFSAGDYVTAKERFEAALAIRRQALGETHPDVGASLNNLGNVSGHLGDYVAARDYYLRALAIRRQALGETHPDVATGLNNLGVVSDSLGDYTAARNFYLQALAIRQQSLAEVHPDVATSLNNLGIVSRHLGDYPAARGYHLQALAIRRQALGETHPDVGASLIGLGNVSGHLGDYTAARDYQLQALAILRQALGETHPAVAMSLNNLGTESINLGDYTAARDYHLQALAILRQALGETHPHVAMSLNNLGTVSADLGDYTAARDYYLQALAINRQSLGETHADVAGNLNNLGLVSANLGDHTAARDYFEQALALWRGTLPELHPLLCEPLCELAALACRERAFDRAGEFLEEALRIALVPNNMVNLAPTYRALSLLKAAEGESDAAIFFGKQAVNAVQRQRAKLTDLDHELQRSFLNTKEDIYRDLSDRLIEAGRLGEAQQVLAMLKEEELFDLLRRDAGNDPRLTLAQLTALETEWKRHGDALGQDLVRLAEQVTALRKIAERSAAQEEELRGARVALDAAGREFRTWLDGLRVELVAAGASGSAENRHSAALNFDLLERMQGELRALEPGVALLSYVLGENKVSIILTTATFQLSREAGISERAVNRLVHELRLAIDQRLDDDVSRTAQALWRHLIAPVFERLREIGITTLMVVPYGTLRYLPFAALHDGTRYLAEHFAVSILTLAAHGAFRERGTSDWQVAGLGVSREVPGYRRLMAVREELAGIIRTAPGEAGIYPGTICLDEAFNEQNFASALDAHQAVHVASHFVLNPAQGLHSHLLLGDGTTLSLERLRDVSFDFHRIELMTLSACETAMGGGSENGREFEGFAALVQRRGVKAVIASLWPVADESTAPLMQAFYRARREGRSKAAALQAAQLSLLNGGAYTYPYHWAPFVLLGNWL